MHTFTLVHLHCKEERSAVYALSPTQPVHVLSLEKLEAPWIISTSKRERRGTRGLENVVALGLQMLVCVLITISRLVFSCFVFRCSGGERACRTNLSGDDVQVISLSISLCFFGFGFHHCYAIVACVVDKVL
jgi:hypothetical protein